MFIARNTLFCTRWSYILVETNANLITNGEIFIFASNNRESKLRLLRYLYGEHCEIIVRVYESLPVHTKRNTFTVLETIINQAWFDKMHNWMKFDVKRRRNPDRDGWLIEWWNAQSSKAADNRNRGCARAKTRASDAQLIDIPTNWCLTRLIITTGRSVPYQRI